ncbi:MAG: squalene/phytoene synthase family protein [bacterium]|nr:squalene/phytoene synthase family protein [bacterium]
MSEQNDLLTTVLKRVSRAFYLSMRILPDGVRQPISIGYLLARAADTVADTPGMAIAERLQRLQRLQGYVQKLSYECMRQSEEVCTWGEGATDGEAKLLRVFPETLQMTAQLQADDRRDVQQVVTTLISGMVEDLSCFPGRFTDNAQLDRYTYLVAGCVGEFWSKIIARHTLALKRWDCAYWSQAGIRFGKALQLTNVLRDAVKDLENGRSYIPGLVREGWLDEVQASEGDYYSCALANLNCTQQNDILGQWMQTALAHYRQAIAYTLSLPWHCWRLRLAVIWPIAIGLATLAKLSSCSADWLKRGKRIKVTRRWVYRMIALTVPLSLCSPALRWWLESWWRSAYAGSQKLRD